MNKTVVILGASRGIGKSLVDYFSKNDAYTVIALSRDVDKMKTQFSHASNVNCFHLDLASNNVKEDCRSILQDVENLDFVINNAGYLVNKPFLELTKEDIERSYTVNVMGIMQTTQACVEKMKNGHIVNISSVGGFQGSVKFPGLAAYSTSKAALCSFTELFAEEYKDSPIKMNCLCLGAVQTEMLEEAFPGYQAPLQPKEMAEFIADFTLKNHHFMNGKIIPVSLSTP